MYYAGDNQVLEDDDMPRTYNRVTPDMQASVIAARERLGPVSYADIAERTGVNERTVKYILVDLPRLRRVNSGERKAEGSLKERIMHTIREMGEVKDVAELRRILGMADTDHDIMHVLHSLHTQGKLDFTERGNGMGTATAVNIHLPRKGKRNGVAPLPVITKDQEAAIINAKHQPFSANHAVMLTGIDRASGTVEVTDPVADGPEATTQETPQPAPSAPEPESEGYPLLTELLDRERTRADADAKALRYVEAAEVLRDIDPESYRSLMDRAAANDVPFPSPLEREYLRYVAAHPDSA
jgi:hypothetical protein